MFEIYPIRAFSDNYIWTLVKGNEVTVVDPGDPKPVKEFLEKRDLTLKNILITHHHFDHTGGIEDLINLSNCEVYGPHGDHIKGINKKLNEGDEFEISNIKFNVFSTPGHTLDHLSYFANAEEPILFCGDTLFAAGCGKILGGTASDLYNSIFRIANLPNNTLVYCAHEYTLANIEFASELFPDDTDIKARKLIVKNSRRQGLATVPTTIKEEKLTNPFLRCKNVIEFTEMRMAKDNWSLSES